MKKVFSSNYDTIAAFNSGARDCRNPQGNIFAHGDVLYSYGTHFILAIRLKDQKVSLYNLFLVNADRYSVTTACHTSLCLRLLKENIQIPFSALRSARINPEKITMIDNSPETWETVKYKDPKTGEDKTRQVHHLGGVLFKYKRGFYLSGFDSQESITRQSYFLTRLSKPASDFKAAIEDLKPDSVKQAIAEGREVKRQGEWFFVKTQAKTRELKKVGRMIPISRNNSHTATEIRKTKTGLKLVRGCIRHKPGHGRVQHAILNLGNSWFEIIKNTARESWQASGLVD